MEFRIRRRWRPLTVWALAPALLLGLIAAQVVPAIAQEGTPEAVEEAAPPRPVHIHSGNCNDLGDVVFPLVDLTQPTGEAVGQRNRAIVAATSFTTVPTTLEALLADNFAINAHLSAEEIGTYIACGEIGGIIDANGSLVIGLKEQNGSGFTGIAFLSPGADGASTNVSVFLVEKPSGGGGRSRAAAGTPTAGGEAEAEETPEA